MQLILMSNELNEEKTYHPRFRRIRVWPLICGRFGGSLIGGLRVGEPSGRGRPMNQFGCVHRRHVLLRRRQRIRPRMVIPAVKLNDLTGEGAKSARQAAVTGTRFDQHDDRPEGFRQMLRLDVD